MRIITVCNTNNRDFCISPTHFCVMQDLKKLNVLLLIFSLLFLSEFFISGRFSIEVKYWKRNFNILIKKKQTDKQTNERKKNKPSFLNKLYLRFIAFSYYNFSLKNIYKGVPFYKICRLYADWQAVCLQLLIE